MSQIRWNISFEILRQRNNQPPYWQSFDLDVDPEEYVLDAVERIWAQKDRSLTYRHACHHSTCGACGMRVNGSEKLTCITTIQSVTHNGGKVRVEPLRNFPVLSDLVVDMGQFYRRMEDYRVDQVMSLDKSYLPYEDAPTGNFERLADCIECGLCISACPIALTSNDYLGPAVLAGMEAMHIQRQDAKLLDQADQYCGVWRCHSAFECSAVCPSNVDPGWRIMDLRKRVIKNRFNRLFNKSDRESEIE